MVRAFSIGRLCEIRLDVHASWLPIYALVTVTLASAAPIGAVGGVAAYAIAAAGALVLFASVVVHELAHALVARRFGVQTTSIALFLFGGVATLEEEPPTPTADALVALAGPAMSVAIAACAYGAMYVVDLVVPAADADAAASLLAYITVANAMLAVFNLIPAYPLDGGRVLRALLWWLRGDRAGATATAALAGMALAGCCAIGGVVAVAATHTWQFGWYVVVAGFVLRTSWIQYVSVRPTTRWASGVASVGVRIADRWSA